jgi:hypothetical protein
MRLIKLAREALMLVYLVGVAAAGMGMPELPDVPNTGALFGDGKVSKGEPLISNDYNTVPKSTFIGPSTGPPYKAKFGVGKELKINKKK